MAPHSITIALTKVVDQTLKRVRDLFAQESISRKPQYTTGADFGVPEAILSV